MPLVPIEEFRDFLEVVGTGQDDVLVPLLDGVTAWFQQETGRTRAPFADALTARVEKQKGTGSDVLHLDYPIADVTSIVLGFDTAAPDDTLDPDDPAVVIWAVGGHTLTRVDGGRFGRFGWPAYVTVTYNTQADLPADAKVAILRVGAALFRQRGSEDVTADTIGGQQATLAQVATDDPAWQMAVANHRRFAL